MYPLMVKMENKECIIVGGGKVAFRKTTTLLKEKANITIISPEVCPELEDLEADGKLTIIKRQAVDDDFTFAFYVVAATNDEQVNKQIAKKLEKTKLVNIASSTLDGNCQVPASFQKGKLILTVSTSGASPMLAKKIRDEWSSVYDDNFEQYLDFLYEAREIIKQLHLSAQHKRELLQEIIDEQYKNSATLRKSFYTLLKNF
ncbi:NAD(P)-binding protein [Niallia sp. 03190]|uniref:NAD(P)-binding protein n=1 Tax=Niallia sp. 03190 TaxID=3458061 RepID=UPI0040445503